MRRGQDNAHRVLLRQLPDETLVQGLAEPRVHDRGLDARLGKLLCGCHACLQMHSHAMKLLDGVGAKLGVQLAEQMQTYSLTANKEDPAVPLEGRRLTAAAHLDHGAISNERHIAALPTQHTLANLRRHTTQMSQQSLAIGMQWGGGPPSSHAAALGSCVVLLSYHGNPACLMCHVQ